MAEPTGLLGTSAVQGGVVVLVDGRPALLISTRPLRKPDTTEVICRVIRAVDDDESLVFPQPIEVYLSGNTIYARDPVTLDTVREALDKES